jgi:predicted trehalose synthase
MEGREIGPQDSAYSTTLEMAWYGESIETQKEPLNELREKAEELGFTVTGAHSATAKEEQPVEAITWGGQPFRNRKALETATPARAGL